MNILKLRSYAWAVVLVAGMSLTTSCASLSRGKTNVDDNKEPEGGFILWRRSL